MPPSSFCILVVTIAVGLVRVVQSQNVTFTDIGVYGNRLIVYNDKQLAVLKRTFEQVGSRQHAMTSDGFANNPEWYPEYLLGTFDYVQPSPFYLSGFNMPAVNERLVFSITLLTLIFADTPFTLTIDWLSQGVGRFYEPYVRNETALQPPGAAADTYIYKVAADDAGYMFVLMLSPDALWEDQTLTRATSTPTQMLICHHLLMFWQLVTPPAYPEGVTCRSLAELGLTDVYDMETSNGKLFVKTAEDPSEWQELNSEVFASSDADISARDDLAKVVPRYGLMSAVHKSPDLWVEVIDTPSQTDLLVTCSNGLSFRHSVSSDVNVSVSLSGISGIIVDKTTQLELSFSRICDPEAPYDYGSLVQQRDISMSEGKILWADEEVFIVHDQVTNMVASTLTWFTPSLNITRDASGPHINWSSHDAPGFETHVEWERYFPDGEIQNTTTTAAPKAGKQDDTNRETTIVASSVVSVGVLVMLVIGMYVRSKSIVRPSLEGMEIADADGAGDFRAAAPRPNTSVKTIAESLMAIDSVPVSPPARIETSPKLVKPLDMFFSLLQADGVTLNQWLDLLRDHPGLLDYKSPERDHTLLMTACMHDCAGAVVAMLACYLTEPLDPPSRTSEVWQPITDYDTQGFTALHHAVKVSSTECVTALATLFPPSIQQMTYPNNSNVLHLALKENHKEMIELLLSVLDKIGRLFLLLESEDVISSTPLAYAREEALPECRDLIEAAWQSECQRYQDLSSTNDENSLMLAVRSRHAPARGMRRRRRETVLKAKPDHYRSEAMSYIGAACQHPIFDDYSANAEEASRKSSAEGALSTSTTSYIDICPSAT
eukprot:m.128109 g.128109  ORF g.128109 m.128109 type:complete len:831 (-) comp15821_c0_seq1:251-2743(-)